LSSADARVDPAGSLEAAAAALQAGGVVAIPTDTLYGLAARVDDEAAIARLFEIKQRPQERSLAVLVADQDQARGLAADVAVPLEQVMERLWPGGVTVVVEADPISSRLVAATDGTVGLRCPDHRWVRDLARRVGPLATTSANLHGQDPSPDANGVALSFGSAVELIVDGGRCDGRASTVVAVHGAEIVILRDGAVDAATVRAATGDRDSTS
jgi:L-threonylcarbamoyladenylate synthase